MGLRVVDISTPTITSEVGSYDTPGSADGVAVEPAGDYVYIAENSIGDSNQYVGKEGLRVIDVSACPKRSKRGGVLRRAGVGRGGVALAPSGDYAYIANEGEDLRVVEVSDPTSPSEVRFYETSGYAQDVAVAPSGDYVYVADGLGGFIILGYGASIAGHVQDSSGNPIADVTIPTSANISATTDANGAYSIPDLSAGTYILTPTNPGWVFTPPTRTVSLPPDATGQDFTMLHPLVSTTLTLSGTANLPNTLVYTDTQGLTTTLTFPRGTVTETTTVASGSANLAFAGHAFDLDAYQGGEHQPGFTFDGSVTITIHYSEQDIRLISDEGRLTLRWWDGDTWRDAAETCSPASAYVCDEPHNVLSVPICHLSRFALIGPTNRVYLSLVLRNQ